MSFLKIDCIGTGCNCLGFGLLYRGIMCLRLTCTKRRLTDNLNQDIAAIQIINYLKTVVMNRRFLRRSIALRPTPRSLIVSNTSSTLMLIMYSCL